MENDQGKIDEFEAGAKKAIDEMIEAIDNFFTVSAFQAIHSPCDNTAGEIVFDDFESRTGFNHFFGFIEHWLPTFIPGHVTHRRRLDALGEFLDGKMDKELRLQWNEFQSKTNFLTYDAVEFGAYFGILVGLRLAGLDRQAMRQKAEGLLMLMRHKADSHLSEHPDDWEEISRKSESGE